MKKIICIIGIILCLTLGGTAAAAISYYDANTVTGSITADSAIVLTIGGTEGEGISLTQGVPTIYTVVCNVNKSASVTPNVTLAGTLSNESATVIKNQIKIEVFTDSACTTLATGDNLILGDDGTFAISGITETSTYYLKVTIDGEVANQEALALIGGSLVLTLTQQSA